MICLWIGLEIGWVCDGSISEGSGGWGWNTITIKYLTNSNVLLRKGYVYMYMYISTTTKRMSRKLDVYLAWWSLYAGVFVHNCVHMLYIRLTHDQYNDQTWLGLPHFFGHDYQRSLVVQFHYGILWISIKAPLNINQSIKFYSQP